MGLERAISIPQEDGHPAVHGVQLLVAAADQLHPGLKFGQGGFQGQVAMFQLLEDFLQRCQILFKTRFTHGGS